MALIQPPSSMSCPQHNPTGYTVQVIAYQNWVIWICYVIRNYTHLINVVKWYDSGKCKYSRKAVVYVIPSLVIQILTPRFTISLQTVLVLNIGCQPPRLMINGYVQFIRWFTLEIISNNTQQVICQSAPALQKVNTLQNESIFECHSWHSDTL